MNKDKIETAWQGKSWRLCVATRELNDGSQFQTAYIDHPGAVVIVPLRNKSSQPEILMLRQYRYALQDSILELPAGTRGELEDWNSCAQRELREETGFEAERFVNLGDCWPAPGVSNERMVIYLAEDLEYNPLPQDSDEEIEVVPYALDALLSMALDGRLQDAKSVVGILRTAFYMKVGHFAN